MSELASPFSIASSPTSSFSAVSTVSSLPSSLANASPSIGNIHNLPRNTYHTQYYAMAQASTTYPRVSAYAYASHYPQMEQAGYQFAFQPSTLFHHRQYPISLKDNLINSSTCTLKQPPLYFSILGDLSRLYEGNTIDTDFTIRTGAHSHRAHRFVLMFRSRYFESLFRSGLQESIQNEMAIDDVAPEVMEAVLQYIYLGTYKVINMEQLLDLIITADRFLLEDLVSALTETILKKMSPQSALQIFKTSELYNFDLLRRKSEQYILENGFLLLQEPSFSELSPEEVAFFLGKDAFCVIEDEVVHFLLNYIEARKEIRDNAVQRSKLLDLARFSMLTDYAKLIATMNVESSLFEAIVAKYNEAETLLEKRAQKALTLSGSNETSALPYRTCYHFSDLKLLYTQYNETFDNGSSTIVSMAPATLAITFSTKAAFNQINFYIRCLNSVHVWFEWSNDDAGNEKGSKESHREWSPISESNSWGANQAFSIKLPRVVYAKYIQMQLKPVSGDSGCGTFPLSLYNLGFSLAFPRQELITEKWIDPHKNNVNLETFSP